MASRGHLQLETAPSVSRINDSVNVNLVVNSNAYGYQANETYIVDDKLHQYNSSPAKVGMRTRSIFIGAPTSVDGNGYFVERMDNQDYDLDMTPWVGYESDYLLGLHSTKFYHLQRDASSCCGGSGDSGSSGGSGEADGFTSTSGIKKRVEFGHTVLHYKNTSRLIIIKRDLSLTGKQQNSIQFVVFLLLLILAVVCVTALGTEGIAVGVLLIVIALVILFYASYNNQTSGNGYSYTTQSIPLENIYWVKREMLSYPLGGARGESTTQQCTNCSESKESYIHQMFSIVTIGFNNISVASNLQNSQQVDAITVNLENNQAYNLQQYLNGIMSGKNIVQCNQIFNQQTTHV